jgi:hypothetical protein
MGPGRAERGLAAPNQNQDQVRRVGQLTYTSYQKATVTTGTDRGGWQVKQQTGDLSPAERRAVDAVLATELQSPVPLSRFPTRAEIDKRPHRLHFGLAGEIALYCFSVNAGPDATGRPDNVFNHVLVDRNPDAALDTDAPMRPIELWDSPRWLSPFGPTEVLDAAFDPDEPPSRAGVLNRRAVIDFLFDESTYRFGALAFLLDAASAALHGGRRVVLATPSSAEGALWVAAVSFLTAPIACLKLSFSTYERLAALTPATAPILSVVPVEDTQDLVRSPSTDFILVEPAEEPDLRTTADGEKWVNRLGEAAVVSDWSRLALDACAQGAEVLDALLDDADAMMSRGCDWPAGDEPGWPLAVVLAQREESRASWPTVAHLVQRFPLTEVPLPENAAAALRRVLVGEDVRTTADAWRRVSDGATHRNLGLFLASYQVYLDFALGDRDWLCGQDAPPVPTVPAVSPLPGPQAVRSTVQAAVQSYVDAGPARDVDGLVLWTRVLDFAVRVLLSIEIPPGAVPELTGLADGVAAGLGGPDGARVVGAVGSISRTCARDCIGEALPHYLSGVPGQRLPAVVARWLSPGFDGVVERMKPAEVGRYGLVAREILVQRCRTEPDFAYRHRVAAALAVLLDQPHQRPEPRAPASAAGVGAVNLVAVLRYVGGAKGWTDAELTEFVRHMPDTWLGEMTDIVTELLFSDRVTRSGWELASAVLERTPEQPPGLLSVYVHLAPGWYRKFEGFPRVAIDILEAGYACWSIATDEQRRTFAPHMVIAAFEIHTALHYHGYEYTQAAKLRDRARNLGSVLNIPRDVVELGLLDALPRLREALSYSSYLMDLAATACAEIVEGTTWDGFLLMRLSADLAHRTGASDVARAILKPYWADFGHREVVDYGTYIAERAFGGRSRARTFLSWWAEVVPRGKGIDRLTGAARAILRGRVRSESTMDTPEGDP